MGVDKRELRTAKWWRWRRDATAARTIECEHSHDGLCLISTSLAGLPVVLAEDACAACKRQDSPMTFNRVTCSKAIYVLRRSGNVSKIPSLLLDCVSPRPTGVGSQFEWIVQEYRSWLKWVGLAWVVRKGEDCGCNRLRSEMNVLSVSEVRNHRRGFARQIAVNWCLHFSAMWLFRVVYWLALWTLDRAIRRAK